MGTYTISANMASNVPPTRYAFRMFTIADDDEMPRPPSSTDNYFFSIRTSYVAVTPHRPTTTLAGILDPQSHLLALGAERVRAIFSGLGCDIPDGAVASLAQTVAEFFQSMAADDREYDAVVTLHIVVATATYGDLNDVEPEWRTALATTEWDYVDHGGDPDDSDEDVTESAAMVWTVPASKSSVEALEIVRIDDTREHCTVCLEGYGFSGGGGNGPALRMPCCHVYHKRCIVRWLKKNHLCPTCRYAMPTSSQFD